MICGSLLLTKLSATTYTLTDLGSGIAKDINTAGHVVGNATTGAWYFDGTNRTTLKFGAHFLGTPADQLLFFTAATANAINDSNRIAGSIIFIPLQMNTRTAYYTDGDGVATLIDSGDALGLNASGVMVGGTPAFILKGAATSTPAGVSPVLTAVNGSGTYVGSVAPNGVAVAASFSDSSFSKLKLQNLDLPDTGNASDYTSTAVGLNNAGQIVGSVTLGTSPLSPKPQWGFLYANDKATGLGTLGGTVVSPQHINAGGTVVGTATISDGSAHAFIFEDGTITDLNLLVTGAFGWVLTSANGINDGGVIVGEGTKNGVQHSFLLRPQAENLAPVIKTQPLGTKVFVGDGFSLAVTASGGTPLSYQWQHAGTNLPGATASSYIVAHASSGDAGSYHVRVSNSVDAVVSDDALLQVEPKDTAPPGLSMALYAGLTITGQVGRSFRIEAVEDAADTSWELLATITLDASPYLWFDSSLPLHRGRIYRAVAVP